MMIFGMKKIHLIILLGFIIRFFGVFSYFPYFFHPDEWNQVSAAIRMIDDLNPEFFNHPSLSILLNSLAINGLIRIEMFFSVLNSSAGINPYLFFIIGRTLTVIFGALTIYLVYKTGRLLWDEKTALLSALTIAILPLHIFHSFYITVDITLTFFTILTIYSIIKTTKKPKTINYIITGLSIGLAASTKYSAALLIPYYLIVQIFIIKKSYKKFITSLIIILLTFLILNPYSIITFDEFYKGLSFEAVHMRTGHTGISLQPENHAWAYLFIKGIIPGLTVFGTILLIISLFILKKDKNFIILILWVLMVYFVNESFLTKAPRYLLPAFPIIALLMGRALRKDKRLNWLLLLTGLITLTALAQLYPDTRAQVTEWVRAQNESFLMYHYTTSFAEHNNESLNWLNNNTPAHIIISNFRYDRFFSEPNDEPEKYEFYSYIINNGTLVKEFKAFYSLGFNNPRISVYRID